MCEYLSTESFWNQITKLTRKKKDGYISVKTDICAKFTGKTFEEIAMIGVTLRNEKEFKLKKIRIENSYQNLGVSGGYRLIYIVRTDRKEIVFLYVYPKRGTHQEIDISDTQLKAFYQSYIDGKIETAKCDINNELELI